MSRFGRRARCALVGLALPALGALGALGAEPVELEPAPLYGADVRSLAFDPRRPDRAVAGTSSGQIYRSDDGGESWRDAGDPVPFPGWVVGSLAFDPHLPDRLWAGLWGIWGGGSVALSDDLGASWTVRSRGLPEGDQVYALAPVPGRSGHLLAGTRSGVWRSEDEGASWRPAAGEGEGPDHVSSLYVDPLDPLRILAGTWRRAWRSDDGGRSWRSAFEGMVLDSEVFAIRAVPARPGELWAATCGWVYRGRGLGERWERVTEGFEERRTPSLLVVSPERVVAGTVGGLHVSTDGGRSFRRTSDARLAVRALAHHPERPERILVGTGGAGIWLSRDGGESLTPRLVATSNLRVPALASSGSSLYAAVAHAGPLSGVYRSPDRGVSFEPRPFELPTVLELEVAGSRVFAATERGLFERSGEEWRSVAELGERRVAELVQSGNRLVARTGDGLWELGREGRFRRIEGAPEGVGAVTFAWGELWARTRDGLYRLPADGPPEAASLPDPAATTLAAVGGGLLVAGPGGLWRRTGPGSTWEPMAAEQVRALATEDPHAPLVLVDGEGLRLVTGDGAAVATLDPDFPPRAAVSALVVGDRLWIGTSGYGLWSAELPEGARAGVAEAAQPEARDERIRR